LLNLNWDSMSGSEFEEFLVAVFKALGYEAHKTGDDHVDLVVTVGTKRIAVQATRTTGVVQKLAVEKVLIGMGGHHCSYCMVITNSTFSTPAEQLASSLSCGLVDRNSLSRLIVGLFIPPTAVLLRTLPAQLPPTQLPPTQLPPTQLPPTQLPPTQLPPTPWPASRLPVMSAAGASAFVASETGNQAHPPIEVIDRSAFRASRVFASGRSVGAGIAAGAIVLLGFVGVVVMSASNRRDDAERTKNDPSATIRGVSSATIRGNSSARQTPQTTIVASPPREIPIAQVIAEQREALATGDPQARIKAAERLGTMGAQAAEGVPALVDSLSSEDPKVKAAVIEALGKIGPAAQPARPALLPLLTNSPLEIRRAAAQSLLKIGVDPAASAQWVKAFQDTDDEVAAAAAQALASAGPLPKEETPMLVDLLKNGKPVQRRHAASFLGAMKAEGKPAISGLADALRDTEKDVRIEAAEALGKIGPSASPAALALGNALKDKEAEVRKASLNALGKIGPDASNAAPSLITALGDSELHDSALNTLVKIGKGAVRDLGRTLTDSRNTKARLELIDILGQIGPDAREAVPTLTKILGSEDFPSVQRAARESLAKIQK